MSTTAQDSSLPIAITMGDPAGIGPEILARTLATSATDSHGGLQQSGTRWILVGTRWALEKGAMCLGQPLPTMNVIDVPADAKPGWNLLDLGIPEPDDFSFGQVQARCGELAVQAVEWAATRCLRDELAAMVTAPINKEAIHAAGYVNDIGHQEILARLAGVSQTADVDDPGLGWCTCRPTNPGRSGAFCHCRAGLGKLHLIHETLSQWGLSNPRIAVRP